MKFNEYEDAAYCPISAPKDHFEGSHYAEHIFNLWESLRRKDNGRIFGVPTGAGKHEQETGLDSNRINQGTLGIWLYT